MAKSALTVEQVWNEYGGKKFETAIKQYHIKSSSIEDIKNDIFLKLIKTNYVGKYDESKGAVSTYLYKFVNNHMKKVWRRENMTRAGKAFGKALSIENSPSDNVQFSESGNKILFLDLFKTSNMEDEYHRTIFVQRLMEELDRPKFSRFRSTGPTGLPRSIKEVVKLILKGYTMPEIASKDLMDTSYTWVRTRLLKLQSITWLKEYQFGV